MNNILEVSNLSINFATRDGSFKAVDDISFNMVKDKIDSILGSKYAKHIK